MSSSLSERSPLPDDIRGELARHRARLGVLADHLHYFRSVTSTNDVAARLADSGAAEGTVVLADAQSAGRGRLGRTWFSPAAAGLYVSIVFRPGRPPWSAGDIAPASRLTLMAGVGLAEGIRASTGLPGEIKWPNDILVGRRKLAGILAEAPAAGSSIEHVILGFGINVQSTAYPRALADRVTSIEMELGRSVERALVLAEVLASIEQGRQALMSGRFDAILTRWRALSPSSRGATVEWPGPDGLLRGRTAGIDDDGALLVRVGDQTERVLGGEIRWL